jgi:hypothetical protein
VKVLQDESAAQKDQHSREGGRNVSLEPGRGYCGELISLSTAPQQAEHRRQNAEGPSEADDPMD